MTTLNEIRDIIQNDRQDVSLLPSVWAQQFSTLAATRCREKDVACWLGRDVPCPFKAVCCHTVQPDEWAEVMRIAFGEEEE